MLQIGDNEGVLCSANQTCYHEKNLQSSFFVVVIWGGVGKREWMLGLSEGCRHASDKNGFYFVHRYQANNITKGLIWRRKWQESFVSLVAPSL